MTRISVIIPCRNEEKYVSDFLESIVNNDYPSDLLEVFVIDGISNDSTLKIVQDFAKNYNFIKILTNEKKTVPHALNLGILNSSGEYIIRLDVHSKIPTDYFSVLIASAKKLDSDNTGTVCITDVKDKTSKSSAIKKVLSNRFGVGNSHFRIGTERVMEVDTVPFGCYKKDIFNKVGLFNCNLDRNQDIELNKRIKKVGGKIMLLPKPQSVYFARENFRSFAENNFLTGYWNILTIYITNYFKSMSSRHLIPLIFLLSLLVPIILMAVNPYFGIIALISLIFYVSLISTISFYLKDETTSFYYLVAAFAVLHFSYGFGSFIGLFRLDYIQKEQL